MGITREHLDNWFTYHPPKSDAEVAAYETLRQAGRTFAEVLIEHTPPGADQNAAIRKVREAVMTANAAIACAIQPDPIEEHRNKACGHIECSVEGPHTTHVLDRPYPVPIRRETD